MFSFLYSYFLIGLACVSLLIGIQVPNFIDQYQKRLDAHLIEATRSLQGFQTIADQFHDGSIDKLIRKHEVSLDPSFRAEAKPIRAIYERKKRFELEASALDTDLWAQAWHVWWASDQELYEETMKNYSASILLNQAAIWFALILALGVVFLVDILSRLAGYLIRPKVAAQA